MKLSVVVPVFNEQDSLVEFSDQLNAALREIDLDYEIIYCDDGSTDQSASLIKKMVDKDKRIKLICFSRNFGKEYALTAGIVNASGDCIISIDSDGQHPPKLIKEFIDKWRNGAQVVVGLRTNYAADTFIKKYGTKLFYKIFNSSSSQHLVPGSTDFRLIDKSVKEEFIKLQENERITRGLIDWLGFKQEYIAFKAPKRLRGRTTYGYKGLFNLAANSFVSMTPAPLFFFGLLGIFITLFSFVFGLVVLVEQVLINDPLKWRFTGTAMLSIFIMFLVGIILMSQGILSLYISQVHSESKKRPLYVIDKSRSIGINE